MDNFVGGLITKGATDIPLALVGRHIEGVFPRVISLDEAAVIVARDHNRLFAIDPWNADWDRRFPFSPIGWCRLSIIGSELHAVDVKLGEFGAAMRDVSRADHPGQRDG